MLLSEKVAVITGGGRGIGRAIAGALAPDALLLLDAGVERKSLYTADVTRTLPVSGAYSPEQRAVYDIVWQAQRAGIAAVVPG